jgi:hypothetical protein
MTSTARAWRAAAFVIVGVSLLALLQRRVSVPEPALIAVAASVGLVAFA